MFSLCRLCANCKDQFELNTQITELESKLALCCGWYPSENQIEMPAKACNSCVDELNKCWYFARSVQNAEAKLIKLLAEQNQLVSNKITEYNEFRADDPDKIDPIDTDFQLDGGTEAEFNDRISIIAPCTENRSNATNVEKNQRFDIESFMQHLNDEDRIVDGTVSADGVAKLEQLYPEMKTFTWTDCLYKCEKCIRTFQGEFQLIYPKIETFFFKFIFFSFFHSEFLRTA